MKYFVIYPDQSPEQLDIFNKQNQHLDINIHPISAPVPSDKLREELIEKNIITFDNLYDQRNLALMQAHISVWKQAVETQSPVTIFEADSITHVDFLKHQEQSLLLQPSHDLMVWGYSLNWNPCIELMPCLPKVIYTFRGCTEEDWKTEGNDLIDVSAYQQNDLDPIQTLRAFSFSGLGCYTLSVKGAEYLLKTLFPIGKAVAPSYQEAPFGTNFYVFHALAERENTSLDIEINRYIEQLNVYMTIPMLAVIPTNVDEKA